MDENKIKKKLGRPSKTSNENENEKSTQTDLISFSNSTQTDFISFSNDEIIKLRKIINLINV